jgi:hypothetical protein
MWKNYLFRRVNHSRIRSDANDLMISHGRLAYDVARRMSRAERLKRLIDPTLPHGHWDHVRRKVRRMASGL